MRLLIMLVVVIYLQTGFEGTTAKGGGRGRFGVFGGRSGGRFGATYGVRGGIFGGGGRARATNSGRLASRYFVYRGGLGHGYALTGDSNDECLPSLAAYNSNDFIDVTMDILRLGGTTGGAIKLAERFLALGINSSIQTWFDLTLELFNVHTTQSNLGQILSIKIPLNPVDETLAKIFTTDNNEKIEKALIRTSTIPDTVKKLTSYLGVFNYYSSTAVNICYDRYKQIINPYDHNMLDIFPSLALLEHSMCRSGLISRKKDGCPSYSSPKMSPRTIKLDTYQDYVLSGHESTECLPSLDVYAIKDFIPVTKTILRMGGTAKNVIELAEQFMNLSVHSSVQTWFDLNIRLFDANTMPLNLTAIFGRKIPQNPLDDTLSAIFLPEINDKIENALPPSPYVTELMDYLRGFDDQSYFVRTRTNYGIRICHEIYNDIVNPWNKDLVNVFPSLATLKDSMCRRGAENARQRSWNVQFAIVLSISLSYSIVFMTCVIYVDRLRCRRADNSNCELDYL